MTLRIIAGLLALTLVSPSPAFALRVIETGEAHSEIRRALTTTIPDPTGLEEQHYRLREDAPAFYIDSERTTSIPVVKGEILLLQWTTLWDRTGSPPFWTKAPEAFALLKVDDQGLQVLDQPEKTYADFRVDDFTYLRPPDGPDRACPGTVVVSSWEHARRGDRVRVKGISGFLVDERILRNTREITIPVVLERTPGSRWQVKVSSGDQFRVYVHKFRAAGLEERPKKQDVNLAQPMLDDASVARAENLLRALGNPEGVRLATGGELEAAMGQAALSDTYQQVIRGAFGYGLSNQDLATMRRVRPENIQSLLFLAIREFRASYQLTAGAEEGSRRKFLWTWMGGLVGASVFHGLARTDAPVLRPEPVKGATLARLTPQDIALALPPELVKGRTVALLLVENDNHPKVPETGVWYILKYLVNARWEATVPIRDGKIAFQSPFADHRQLRPDHVWVLLLKDPKAFEVLKKNLAGIPAHKGFAAADSFIVQAPNRPELTNFLDDPQFVRDTALVALAIDAKKEIQRLVPARAAGMEENSGKTLTVYLQGFAVGAAVWLNDLTRDFSYLSGDPEALDQILKSNGWTQASRDSDERQVTDRGVKYVKTSYTQEEWESQLGELRKRELELIENHTASSEELEGLRDTTAYIFAELLSPLRREEIALLRELSGLRTAKGKSDRVEIVMNRLKQTQAIIQGIVQGQAVHNERVKELEWSIRYRVQRLLIVAGDPALRKFLVEWATTRRRTLQITEVESPEKALALWNTPDPFDAVLAGYDFPGGQNGIQFIEAIQSRSPQEKVPAALLIADPSGLDHEIREMIEHGDLVAWQQLQRPLPISLQRLFAILEQLDAARKSVLAPSGLEEGRRIPIEQWIQTVPVQIMGSPDYAKAIAQAGQRGTQEVLDIPMGPAPNGSSTVTIYADLGWQIRVADLVRGWQLGLDGGNTVRFAVEFFPQETPPELKTPSVGIRAARAGSYRTDIPTILLRDLAELPQVSAQFLYAVASHPHLAGQPIPVAAILPYKDSAGRDRFAIFV